MQNSLTLPIKVEGNLIEYPFFWLGGNKRDVYKEYELGEITIDGGIITKRRLIVENRRGIPGPYDQDVLMGILRIGTKNKNLTEDIPLTVYEVAKEIDDLGNWVRVKNSIEKLVTTNYKSEQVILIKETDNKYYLNDFFHILESATFLDGAIKNKRKANLFTKVRFNKFFINNFLNDYYKYIDLKKYLELRSPTAKKLYLYLEKKKFKKDVYQVNLDTLASILPLEVNQYFEIRKVLKRAHEKLIESSVIKSFEFDKNKVIYHFHKDQNLDVKKNKDDIEDELLKELIEIGITQKVAQDLMFKHSRENIKIQIENLKYRKGENRAGLLIKSIVEDWAQTPELLKREEKLKKEKEVVKEKESSKEFEEKISEIIKELSENQLSLYYSKAQKKWEEEGGIRIKKNIPAPYRDLLLNEFIKEDFNLN